MLRPHLPFALAICLVSLVAPAEARDPFATHFKFTIEDREHDVVKKVDAFYVVHTPPSFPEAWFLVEMRRIDFDPWERSMGKVTRSVGDDGKDRLTVKWESGPLKGRTETAKIHNGLMQWLKPEKGLSPHGEEAFELNATKMPAQAAELIRFMNYTSLSYALKTPIRD